MSDQAEQPGHHVHQPRDVLEADHPKAERGPDRAGERRPRGSRPSGRCPRRAAAAGRACPAAAAKKRTPASLPASLRSSGVSSDPLSCAFIMCLLLTHRHPGPDVERRSTIGTMAVAKSGATLQDPLARAIDHGGPARGAVRARAAARTGGGGRPVRRRAVPDAGASLLRRRRGRPRRDGRLDRRCRPRRRRRRLVRGGGLHERGAGGLPARGSRARDLRRRAPAAGAGCSLRRAAPPWTATPCA